MHYNIHLIHSSSADRGVVSYSVVGAWVPTTWVRKGLNSLISARKCVKSGEKSEIQGFWWYFEQFLPVQPPQLVFRSYAPVCRQVWFCGSLWHSTHAAAEQLWRDLIAPPPTPLPSGTDRVTLFTCWHPTARRDESWAPILAQFSVVLWFQCHQQLACVGGAPATPLTSGGSTEKL